MKKIRKQYAAGLLSLVLIGALLCGNLAGIALRVKAADATATPITADNQGQLRIPGEDNLLAKAKITGFVSTGVAGAATKPYLYDNQLGGLDFDGPVDGTNANRGYAINASSKPYNYLQIDMEEEYNFTSFLYGGYYAANSRSCAGIEIYVGDKTKEEIEAGGVTPDFTYMQDIHHLRVDFAQPLRGRYMVVKCYAVISNTYIFFTEFGATGKPAAAADSIVATPITAANADQLRIKTEDNILVNAKLTGFVTNGTPGSMPKPYLFDNQLGGLDFDTPADGTNANRGYAINASSKPYNYLQIDMEAEYDFTSFLFGGYYAANSRSCAGIEIYVGDKTKEEIEAGGVTPDFTYMQDIHHLRVDFAQPLRGRYMVVKCYAVVSNSYIFFTELGATGVPYAAIPVDIATPVTAKNADEYRIAPENNILTDALFTGAISSGIGVLNSQGALAASKPLLTDGMLAGIDVADPQENTHWLRAYRLDGKTYNYVTMDLGATFDVSSFFFGGNSTTARSCGGLEIYVGDKTAEEIEAGGVTPNYSYQADIYHLRVDFAQPLRGRYIVIKCEAVNSATLLFFSELAAMGTPIKPVRDVVCVGDSCTFGAHMNPEKPTQVLQFENNYPAQLRALLNEADTEHQYRVYNAGISGSSVVHMPSNGFGWLQTQDNFVRKADIVLIMLGGNDANAVSNTEYRQDNYINSYEAIINAYRGKNPNAAFYVITTPYSGKEALNNLLADTYIPMQVQIAAANDCQVVDVHSATKKFCEEKGTYVYLDAQDIVGGILLHPTEAGLAVIAKTCCDTILGGTAYGTDTGRQIKAGYTLSVQNISRSGSRVVYDLGTRRMVGQITLQNAGQALNNLRLYITDAPDTLANPQVEGQYSAATNSQTYTLTTAAAGRYVVLEDSALAAAWNGTMLLVGAADPNAPARYPQTVTPIRTADDLNRLPTGDNLLKGASLQNNTLGYLQPMDANNTPLAVTNPAVLTDGLCYPLNTAQTNLATLPSTQFVYDLRGNAAIRELFLFAGNDSASATQLRVYIGNDLSRLFQDDPAATVSFTAAPGQLIHFDEPVSGRYVGFRAAMSASGAIGFGELAVYGDYEQKPADFGTELLSNKLPISSYIAYPGQPDQIITTNIRYMNAADENGSAANFTNGNLEDRGTASAIYNIGSSGIKIDDGTRIWPETPWLVYIYSMEGTAAIHSINLTSSNEPGWYVAGADYYVGDKLATLFDPANRVFTSGGDKTVVNDSGRTILDPDYDCTGRTIEADLLTDNVSGRYVAVVITRPHSSTRAGYSMARIAEIQVNGVQLTTEEPFDPARQTVTDPATGIRVTLSRLDADDVEFFDDLGTPQVTKQPLASGIKRDLEENWVTVDSDAYTVTLRNKAGQALTADQVGQRYWQVEFPATQKHFQMLGLVNSNQITRLKSSRTSADGTKVLGGNGYGNEATIYGNSLCFVYLRFHTVEEIQKLNGVIGPQPIRLYQVQGMAQTAAPTRFPTAAVAISTGLVLCTAAGIGWFLSRRRRRTPSSDKEG